MKDSDGLKILDKLDVDALNSIAEELGYPNLRMLREESDPEQIGEIINIASRLMGERETSEKSMGSGSSSRPSPSFSVGMASSPSGSDASFSSDEVGTDISSPTKSIASAGAGSSSTETVVSGGAGTSTHFVRPSPYTGEVTATPEIIRRLLRMGRMFGSRKGEDLVLEGSLPPAVFNELAVLSSAYSSHLGQKTVIFKNGNLVIDPSAASTNSSKDTYADKSLEAVFLTLRREIINQAKMYSGESPEDKITFAILSTLFHRLTTLREDVCNQQNAMDFAKILQQYTPKVRVHEEALAAARPVINFEYKTPERKPPGSDKGPSSIRRR